MVSRRNAYEASRVKRRRATPAEMEARARFLIDYAEQHGPVTVRGLLLPSRGRQYSRHRQDRCHP